MSSRPESDEGKTSSRGDVFKGSPGERPRSRRAAGRVAIVLGGGAVLFAAGVFFGRLGKSGDAPPAPQLVGFDAASIQLLDASLELAPIEGFDAGDVGSDR
jgi:hypothetical protein